MTSTTHDNLREDAGLYVLGALDPSAKALFEAHLDQCRDCRAETVDLMPVVTGLAAATPQVSPSPALRERILAIARGTIEPSGARPLPAAARRTSSNTAMWGWLAAAASFVACIALGAYAMQLQARVDSLNARLATAEQTLSAMRSEVVEARRTLGAAESNIQILLAPDLRRVPLQGQPPSQAAEGHAFYSPSTGLLFTASNLPPLPAGRSFQLWVVTARAPVSAGLLVPDPRGAVTTTLPPPPTSDAPVAFAVTIEPAGGVPAPTGEKVLVGLVGH